MNFLNSLGNRKIPLIEIQRGCDIIMERLDAAIKDMKGAELRHYLEIKNNIARAMGLEIESRRIDAEKDEIIYRMRDLENLDFAFRQEIEEERMDREEQGRDSR